MSGEWDEYRRGFAERWLDHVAGHRRRCDALRALVEAKREEMDGLRSVEWCGRVGHADTHGDDAMVKAVARVQGAIADYLAELDILTGEQADAHDRLCSMGDETGAAALSMHYLAGVEWSEVADRLGYSERHVFRVRDSALAEAYGVMPPEWRDPLPPAM